MAMTSNRLPAPINGRQGPVVTQTITRPFTTITAVVTLGDDPATSSTSNPTTPTTSTITSAGPISPAPPSAITPEQLGAILGSILGFALLALLICCCLSARRRRRQQTTTRISSYTDYYDDDSSVSEREVVVETTLRSTPAWNRPPLRPWPVAPPTTTGAAGAAAGGSGGGGGWTTVPPPVRFPPTPRYTPYRQTRHPQMPGVMRRP